VPRQADLGLRARAEPPKLQAIRSSRVAGGAAMTTVLFVVKATIAPEQEDAFNRWYNEEHCPQLLQFRGAVSARRYKAIMGEDKYQYVAVYEFESEATFQRFLDSGHLEQLKQEYDAHFGGVSERARAAYLQVWP
jgi:antibiotic biosynthesis monooxygenase (ABM) superfamily enzyme